jgi:hypothetical protein
VSDILTHPTRQADLDRLYGVLSSLKHSVDKQHTTGGHVVAGAGPIPEGDPGYDYLRNVSREDAIKVRCRSNCTPCWPPCISICQHAISNVLFSLCTQILNPLPEGSFLLRPHETHADQYFLSFRTGSSATRSTTSKDASVKHAIIRRSPVAGAGSAATVGGTQAQEVQGDLTAAGMERHRSSSDHNESTMTIGASSGIADFKSVGSVSASGGGEHGAGSLSSVVVPGITAGQELGVDPVGAATPLATATAVPTASGDAQYSYQCGKIGPCHFMQEMLR